MRFLTLTRTGVRFEPVVTWSRDAAPGTARRAHNARSGAMACSRHAVALQQFSPAQSGSIAAYLTQVDDAPDSDGRVDDRKNIAISKRPAFLIPSWASPLTRMGSS